MKKLLLSFGLALCVSAVSAQEIEVIEISTTTTNGFVNKKGMQILPQAGDFALGVSAAPFLKYAGNMFTSAHNDAPTFGEITLYGKYFLKDNQAIRARLFINTNKDTYKNMVINDAALAADLTSTAMVDDVYKVGNTVMGLMLGYEWRRGYGRLQGYYGAEFGLNYYSGSYTYEYGNSFSETNTTPTTTTDFDTRANGPVSERTLKIKNGGSVGFGLGGFAGVEYFVAPKISIGGEIGLGFVFKAIAKGEHTTETWDAANNQVKETKVENYSANEIEGHLVKGQHVRFKSEPLISHVAYYVLDPTGNIFLIFHF